VYGNKSVVYRGPEAVKITSMSEPRSVTVSFDPKSMSGGLIERHNECPFTILRDQAKKTSDINCPKDINNCIKKCGWWEVYDCTSRAWQNATAAITGSTVVLTTSAGGAGAPSAARYLFGDWPVATLFNGAGFPALPFCLTTTKPATGKPNPCAFMAMPPAPPRPAGCPKSCVKCCTGATHKGKCCDDEETEATPPALKLDDEETAAQARANDKETEAAFHAAHDAAVGHDAKTAAGHDALDALESNKDGMSVSPRLLLLLARMLGLLVC